MKLDATVDGKTVRVDVRGEGGGYRVAFEDRQFEVDFYDSGRDFVSLLIDGRSYEVGLEKRANGYGVFFSDDTLDVELTDALASRAAAHKKDASGPARIAAPMPGKLVRLLVEVGQQVDSGQGLVVIEAMKMENELRAPRAGKVKEMPVQEGQAVDAGALLIVIE